MSNIKTMINITGKAIEKIGQLLDEEEKAEDLALRIAVKPGGCSGYNYDMYFDSKFNDEKDTKMNYDKVNVIVDKLSLDLLKNIILDYKDGLDAGFSINNPSAQKTCGCGQSFC